MIHDMLYHTTTIYNATASIIFTAGMVTEALILYAVHRFVNSSFMVSTGTDPRLER